jgi:hypothetical protein
MRRFFVSPTSHRLRDLLLIGFALLSAAFVIAIYASVPGADGLIHGCYQANTGQLRVVDADTGTGCRVAEVAVGWRWRWRAQPAHGRSWVCASRRRRGHPTSSATRSPIVLTRASDCHHRVSCWGSGSLMALLSRRPASGPMTSVTQIRTSVTFR